VVTIVVFRRKRNTVNKSIVRVIRASVPLMAAFHLCSAHMNPNDVQFMSTVLTEIQQRDELLVAT